MKLLSVVVLLIAIAVMSWSCNEQNEDIVKQPSKDGSIETQLSIAHRDGFDILTTVHRTWIKGTLAKTMIYNDTLPSLGTTQEEGEDDDGNTKQLTLPKDYEFYITVK